MQHGVVLDRELEVSSGTNGRRVTVHRIAEVDDQTAHRLIIRDVAAEREDIAVPTEGETVDDRRRTDPASRSRAGASRASLTGAAGTSARTAASGA